MCRRFGDNFKQGYSYLKKKKFKYDFLCFRNCKTSTKLSSKCYRIQIVY